MLIENYKGVEIKHDALKYEFYTDIIINQRSDKKEYIRAGRLQKIRDDIDKFLNTAGKKPLVKKAWLAKGSDEDYFELVDIIIFNTISGTMLVKEKDSVRLKEIKNSGYRSDKIYLCCKENNAIVEALNKKAKEIDKIKKEVSCSSGKLIPVKPEHFI